MDKPKFSTTTKASDELGCGRVTMYRACVKHPGFAIRVNARFYIPDDHIRRLKAGETIQSIAAKARELGASHAA